MTESFLGCANKGTATEPVEQFHKLCQSNNFVLMEILLTVLGIVVGGFAGWFAFRLRSAGDLERINQLQSNIQELKQELTRERAVVIEAKRSLATAEANYKN